MNDQIAIRLDESNRALARQMASLERVQRAALPQWFSDRSLRVRYGDIDAKQLRALLEHHRIESKPRGRGLLVHINEVLRLDEILEVTEPIA